MIKIKMSKAYFAVLCGKKCNIWRIQAANA